MGKPWEKHRVEIVGLYIGDSMKLDEVIRIMEEKSGFKASKRAYRGRLKKWGVGKYNLKKRQPKALEKANLEKAIKRASHEQPGPDDTVYRQSIGEQPLSRTVGTAVDSYAASGLNGVHFRGSFSSAGSPSQAMPYSLPMSPMSTTSSCRDQMGFEQHDGEMTPSSSTSGMSFRQLRTTTQPQPEARGHVCQARPESTAPLFSSTQTAQLGHDMHLTYSGFAGYYQTYANQDRYPGPQNVRFNGHSLEPFTGPYVPGATCTLREDGQSYMASWMSRPG